MNRRKLTDKVVSPESTGIGLPLKPPSAPPKSCEAPKGHLWCFIEYRTPKIKHPWRFIGRRVIDEEVWECSKCGGRIVGYYNEEHKLPPTDQLIDSQVKGTDKKLTCEERRSPGS